MVCSIVKRFKFYQSFEYVSKNYQRSKVTLDCMFWSFLKQNNRLNSSVRVRPKVNLNNCTYFRQQVVHYSDMRRSFTKRISENFDVSKAKREKVINEFLLRCLKMLHTGFL